MVLNFAVATLNICNKWLLMTSNLPYAKSEEARGSEQQKDDVHVRFWELSTPTVHVDTTLKKWSQAH